jgi:mono/diheme cytochrome c family protein
MEVTQMTRQRLAIPFLVLTLTLVSGIFLRAGEPAEPTTPASKAAAIERGKYLVNFGSCNDCHTPWKLGPKGPEPDMTRALTGHPADAKVSPSPTLEGSWGMAAANTMTAWTGPWGVSFTANLTPDKETGLGDWTEEMFIQTMRTGRHQGKGRAILPPMPWFSVNALSDEDIKAVFAYLQSLPPVHNRVPAPIDPPEAEVASSK